MSTYLVVRVRLSARQLERLLLCGDESQILRRVCEKTTGFLNYYARWTNKHAGAFPYPSSQMAMADAVLDKPRGRKVVVQLQDAPSSVQRRRTLGTVLGTTDEPLRVARIAWPIGTLVESIGRLNG